jgi:hypothetical protein
MQIEDLFGEVCFHYGEEQGIEDGVLVHPYPELWPWALVTRCVYDACEEKTAKGRTLDQVLKPLMVDAIREVRRQMGINPHCDLVELEGTAAGTVWVRPNAKGGLTIMLPEEN